MPDKTLLSECNELLLNLKQSGSNPAKARRRTSCECTNESVRLGVLQCCKYSAFSVRTAFARGAAEISRRGAG